MGWWFTDDGHETGDGPLILADEFLENLKEEYETYLGRKPTLNEVLVSVRDALQMTPSKYVSDCKGLMIVGLVATTQKKPKRKRTNKNDQ